MFRRDAKGHFSVKENGQNTTTYSFLGEFSTGLTFIILLVGSPAPSFLLCKTCKTCHVANRRAFVLEPRDLPAALDYFTKKA